MSDDMTISTNDERTGIQGEAPGFADDLVLGA